MKDPETKPEEGSDVFAIPEQEKEPSFAARKLLSCAASYVAGWLFVGMFYGENYWYMLPLGLLMMIWELSVTRGRKRSREHILWLVCLWCSVLFIFHACIGKSMSLIPLPGAVHVWTDGIAALLFPVLLLPWWVQCCSGLMLDGHSSGWFLADAWIACVVLPFRNYFGRIVTLGEGVRFLRNGLDERRQKTLGYGLVTLGIAVLFLIVALVLMSCADAGFAALLSGVGDLPVPDGTLVARFFLSLPVGAYYYCLVFGSAALPEEYGRQKKQQLTEKLQDARRLPVGCWYGVLIGFSLLYAVFFCVQGQELLQVLRSMLAPGDETMAQYAVRGFFEMCLLIALNFGLIMTALITSARSLRRTALGKALMTVLQAENLLFALSAALKLWLYFHAFGITSLRLQGAWGILVLSCGCVCWLIWLWTGRKTGRFWCCFIAVTLMGTMVV